MGAKEDIDLLESKVNKLKTEYEQYFMRILKREPAALRGEVDKLILAYSNKNISNTSAKFKYNSTVARYNSYKQYWNRVLRAIDEGTYVRKGEGGAIPSSPVDSRPEPVSAKAPAQDGKAEIRNIFEKYIEAKRQCAEPVDGITFEAVAKTIEQQKKKAEEVYKTNDIELNVVVKDGKVKLTMKPKKTA